MKRIILTVMACAIAASLTAQVEVEEYERFKQEALKSYNDFRRQANEEYAKFMSEAWKTFNAEPAEEIPRSPKPPQPIVVVAPDTKPKPVKIDLLPTPPQRPATPLDKPQPIQPLQTHPLPQTISFSLLMFGTSYPFYHEMMAVPWLKDATEKSVAAMWAELSDPRYDVIIAECLANRETRNLCDWAYIKLTEAMAEKYYDKGTNEAIVMQFYLLVQSGYQMRIGCVDGRLTLLIGSREKIYHCVYYKIGDVMYYLFDQSLRGQPMRIFDHAYPKEKTLSLALTQPQLLVDLTDARTIRSKRYPEMMVEVQTNTNLIEFYNSYPVSAEWQNYSNASLSEVLKETLYPVLRKAIDGKSEIEAANMLINFVQTGFEYATDDVQFGYERPLFPDETFFYPYSDCEDRAILFSCLVRELMGLDVVLLDYPDHLATAVHFNEDVTGDYVEVDGTIYIISDPTYINANVGMCADRYKNIAPKVVRS